MKFATLAALAAGLGVNFPNFTDAPRPTPPKTKSRRPMSAADHAALEKAAAKRARKAQRSKK